LDIETQYAALSHRWGTDKSCVLSSTNITAYQEKIPLSDISATIPDSAAGPRALGLHICGWILCASPRTISVTGLGSQPLCPRSMVYRPVRLQQQNSGCGSSGCFATRNQYRVRPCHVPNPFNTDSKYSFCIRSQYLHHIHDREVRGSLWYNRGWIFQERTLSPRLLMFCGTQILWACEQLQAAETWPCGKTSENYIDQFVSFKVEKARFYKLLDHSCGVSADHSTWWEFLQDYMTSAQLTIRSDRLVAIQGIATLIQGLTGKSYCAGFWLNDDLPDSLLWKPGGTILPRPNEYRAPSWFWAAVEGTIEPNPARSRSTTKLIRILRYEYL